MAMDRPLPQPDPDTAPFWEGCRAGELRAQRCAGCETLRHPPRPMCPRCGSTEALWERLSGRGTLFSFVVAHPPVLPVFRERVPMPVVLVELAEDPGLRLIGNVVDCAPEELRIGLPLEVTFEAVAEDVTLPQWRPAPPVG